MTGLGENIPRTTGAILRQTLPAWAGLMLLLGATLGGAYLQLGPWNVALGLGIAATKAALVMIIFMQLRRPNPLLRLASFAALLFVAFMFLLTYADVLRRAPPTQPGTVTPSTTTSQPASGTPAF